LVFARQEGRGADLYVMSAAGGRAVRITDTPRAFEFEPTFRP
jgi:hypothetical protein